MLIATCIACALLLNIIIIHDHVDTVKSYCQYELTSPVLLHVFL